MLNPSYKLGVLPRPNESQKSYVLRLPYHKAISFTDLKENMYASCSNPYGRPVATAVGLPVPENETLGNIKKSVPRKSAGNKNKITYYRVRRGDGLYVIANKHKCTISELKKWNGLHSNAIKPGQLLAIHRG